MAFIVLINSEKMADKRPTKRNVFLLKKGYMKGAIYIDGGGGGANHIYTIGD